jgi:hypothetical protein
MKLGADHLYVRDPRLRIFKNLALRAFCIYLSQIYVHNPKCAKQSTEFSRPNKNARGRVIVTYTRSPTSVRVVLYRDTTIAIPKRYVQRSNSGKYFGISF